LVVFPLRSSPARQQTGRQGGESFLFGKRYHSPRPPPLSSPTDKEKPCPPHTLLPLSCSEVSDTTAAFRASNSGDPRVVICSKDDPLFPSFLLIVPFAFSVTRKERSFFSAATTRLPPFRVDTPVPRLKRLSLLFLRPLFFCGGRSLRNFQPTTNARRPPSQARLVVVWVDDFFPSHREDAEASHRKSRPPFPLLTY